MNGDQRGHAGTELGHFLRAHRTHITPQDAGLPRTGGVRRTPGLRREEVATLAGVSIDYYARLERGTETNPSPAVIDALARALKLDVAGHSHLRELVACAARSVSQPLVEPDRSMHSGIHLLLENMRPYPAYVLSRTMDVIACSPSGLRLFPGMGDVPAHERNFVRYFFLHPQARLLFDDWGEQIRACVGRLRALAGTEPDAPDLTALIGQLHAKSPEFTDLWERYDVRWHTHGSKTFHHPQVGDINPGYQSMLIEGTAGQRFVTYFAEPGTPDHDKLIMLDAAVPETPATALP